MANPTAGGAQASQARNPDPLKHQLRLYPLIDLHHLPHGDIHGGAQAVRRAVSGGATAIQLREKGERWQDLRNVQELVTPLLQQWGVPLIINDRVDLAVETNADGVHLGQSDTEVSIARQLAVAAGRSRFIIGLSVSTLDEATRGVEAGADYLSISPVFSTATKPNAPKAAGLEGLRAIRSAFPDTPLVVIGGVKPRNARTLVEAGADGLAFVSPLHSQPEASVRAMGAAIR